MNGTHAYSNPESLAKRPAYTPPMADNPAYKKPVQSQPNVADDPAGQKSGVRGVPVHLQGKTMDDATGMPKSDDKLEAQEKQARAIETHGETEKNPEETQDS